jgi:exosortase/archaeosortase family protein
MIRNNLLSSAAWFIQHFSSIHVVKSFDTLYYNDQFSFQIVDTCLGIKLMYIYAMLIIAYPGSKTKHKLWFIPMGFAILHLLNITRVIVVGYVIVYTNYFEFIHGFVFRVLFYGTTFLLWYIWIRFYVDNQKFNDDKGLVENVQETEKIE